MAPPSQNHDEPDSLRGLTVGETALLRREWDRDIRERLRDLERRQDHLEHTITDKMGEIRLELRRLLEQQAEQGPALDALNKMVNSGLALRWLVIGVVGLLASLATVLTAWEAVRKWLP